MTTTDITHNFRVTRGYTTSKGDGDTERIAFFKTLAEALAAGRAEVSTLRIVNRNGLIITDDVIVEELDNDGEPVGQPLYWAKACEVIFAAR